MNHRSRLVIVLLAVLCCLASCSRISKRMPNEIAQMHEFLTKDSPRYCHNYHYNFERQTPRLYGEQQLDSILDVIDYIKTECGPAANLEVTRTLLLADRGQFSDSLIGSATIPQMLWHRSKQENLMRWQHHSLLYGSAQPMDNSHDNFVQFESNLAEQVSSNPDATPQGQTLGLFYSGHFDSAFSHIQSDEMRDTKLRESYEEFVGHTKHAFPDRANVGFIVGSWSPQGNNRLLGNHPDIGIQLGGEGRRFRVDGIVSYRFSPAKNEFLVDSSGSIVPTTNFNSWLFGIEGGMKVIHKWRLSTDIFIGLGYDVIFSVTEAGDPEEYVTHGSLGASIGLRQRIFLNKRTGWYIGGIARYSFVDYGNPGGTDLSGNTLTIGLVTGWSLNATLNQFLDKLNYKGNRRL